MANELQWNEWKMREIKKKTQSYIRECNVSRFAFVFLVSPFFARNIRKLLFRFDWDQWYHWCCWCRASKTPLQNTVLFRRHLFLFFFLCSLEHLSAVRDFHMPTQTYNGGGKHFSNVDYIKSDRSEGIDFSNHWLESVLQALYRTMNQCGFLLYQIYSVR